MVHMFLPHPVSPTKMVTSPQEAGRLDGKWKQGLPPTLRGHSGTGRQLPSILSNSSTTLIYSERRWRRPQVCWILPAAQFPSTIK